MNAVDSFTRLGELYAASFDGFNPALLPVAKREQYLGWVSENPQYSPKFSSRMSSAVDWVRANPVVFVEMITDLDAAISFLNNLTEPVDPDIYANVAEYWCASPRSTELPTLKTAQESGGRVKGLGRAIVDSARHLRLEETIRPEDGEYYSYHLCTESTDGMVAASMLDLYENYARALGLYPDSKRDALVAGALREAVHLTRPKGKLFEILRRKEDGWIYVMTVLATTSKN